MELKPCHFCGGAAEIALEALRNSADHYADIDQCTEEAIRMCMRTIHKIPAADVAPVRHGEWLDIGSLSCRCSECGCKSSKEYRWCPNCGAKMDEEEDTDESV